MASMTMVATLGRLSIYGKLSTYGVPFAESNERTQKSPSRGEACSKPRPANRMWHGSQAVKSLLYPNYPISIEG